MYPPRLRLVVAIAFLPCPVAVQLQQHLLTEHKTAPVPPKDDAENVTGASHHAGAVPRARSQKGAVTSHLTSAGDVIHFRMDGEEQRSATGSVTSHLTSTGDVIHLRMDGEEDRGDMHAIRNVTKASSSSSSSAVLLASGNIDFAHDAMHPVSGVDSGPVHALPAALASMSQTPTGTAPAAAPPAGAAPAVPAAAAVTGVAAAPAAVPATAAAPAPGAAPAAGAAPGAAAAPAAGAAAAATAPPANAEAAALAPGAAAAAAAPADTTAPAAATGGGGFGIGMLILLVLVFCCLGTAVAMLVFKGQTKAARKRASLMGDEKDGVDNKSDNFWSAAKSRQSYRKQATLAAAASSGGSADDSGVVGSAGPKLPTPSRGMTGTETSSASSYRDRAKDRKASRPEASEPEDTGAAPRSGSRARGGGGTRSMPLTKKGSETLKLGASLDSVPASKRAMEV